MCASFDYKMSSVLIIKVGIIIIMIAVLIFYIKQYQKNYRIKMIKILEKHQDLFASIKNITFKHEKRLKIFKKIRKVSRIVSEEEELAIGVTKRIYNNLSIKYKKILFEYIFVILKKDIMQYVSMNKTDDLLDKLERCKILYYDGIKDMNGCFAHKYLLVSIQKIALCHKILIHICHQLGYEIYKKIPELKKEAYNIRNNCGKFHNLVLRCIKYKPIQNIIHGVSINLNDINRQSPQYTSHHSIHEIPHPFNINDMKLIDDDIVEFIYKHFKTMSNIYKKQNLY